MDAFTAGLLQRIKATETDLTHAREAGDDFLADVEQEELDDLQPSSPRNMAWRSARPASDQPVRRIPTHTTTDEHF